MEVAEDAVTRDLYGGAMTVNIPERFTDISQFRQLPDNQEVYADAVTDQSIIIEILELADEVAADKAAEFHFNSLAHDNSALESNIEASASVTAIADAGTKTICHGLQKVSKFNEAAARANTVRIYVCCLRYPNVTTDIVISLNAPIAVNNTSSSADAIDAGHAEALSNPELTKALFETVVESLQIKTWSLFG
eukprot:TRINITY_DN834_c0_g1_i1.p1 TRINITY_DN834_c0_g1~~TRINITY_DN834_c0_g1_i1.p1  ORF type:complete len:193 (+),score=47.50 TRINITY_DN834_c0_g1_i1:122-700(+)